MFRLKKEVNKNRQREYRERQRKQREVVRASSDDDTDTGSDGFADAPRWTPKQNSTESKSKNTTGTPRTPKRKTSSKQNTTGTPRTPKRKTSSKTGPGKQRPPKSRPSPTVKTPNNTSTPNRLLHIHMHTNTCKTYTHTSHMLFVSPPTQIRRHNTTKADAQKEDGTRTHLVFITRISLHTKLQTTICARKPAFTDHGGNFVAIYVGWWNNGTWKKAFPNQGKNYFVVCYVTASHADKQRHIMRILGAADDDDFEIDEEVYREGRQRWFQHGELLVPSYKVGRAEHDRSQDYHYISGATNKKGANTRHVLASQTKQPI